MSSSSVADADGVHGTAVANILRRGRTGLALLANSFRTNK